MQTTEPNITLTQILTHLNVLNAEVALCRSTYRYSADDERWACSITLENDRSELKIRANAADGDLALVAAYEKLLPLINASQVCAAFAVPALTAPADITPQTADSDA